MSVLRTRDQHGFSLVELLISIVVLGIIVLCIFGLFTTLVQSALLTKQRAVALTLATNRMEYLKSLPYDNLAVAGGSIYTTNPLPATTTSTINGMLYTVRTSINYVDDAYDGCGSYPSLALKQLFCRNYPPPTGAPATDTNAADYKILHVKVTDKSSLVLAEVDTQVAARVSETASTTGALLVGVLDNNGNSLDGVTVAVTNSTVTPNVSVSDTTDENGYAVFYGLPPDTTNYDYVITASKTSYSTLSTITPTGTLQPVYPNQRIFSQQSSLVTLTLKLQGSPSIAIETTDTNGNPLGNVRVYAKGGYKRYTATTDTSYYYDNFSPDTRPTTDAGGLAAIDNLVPGPYIFCGDSGASNCRIGSTLYYLAAAVPYAGSDPFSPIAVPTYDASSPPATTFSYNGNNYLQKVRLMLTTSSSFPRVTSLTPNDASLSGGTIGAFGFQITGVNLPCSSSAASCSTTVRFLQGASTYTASCTGASSGLQLNCTVDLTGSTAGGTQLVIIAGGNTLTLPAAPLLGGINVTP